MDHIDHTPPPFGRSRAGLALLIVAAVGGLLLFTEHRAHVLGFLPYALLLACPLMHKFMHHGQHHRHGDRSNAGRIDDERTSQ